MKLRTLVARTLGASLLAALPFSAASATECTVESPCVLRIATVAPENTPWSEQLRSIERRIERESGNRINVRVFLSQADGENSLARQCKDGSLEAVGVSTGAIATLVPEMGVFEIPFLFRTAEQADGVIDNHLFGPIEEILGANGFQLYVFSENGYRNFATSNGRPVRTPADLGSVQMRSQELWIHEAMYRALGGNPVTIPTPEVTTALSSGNVQGFDNTALFAMAAGWTSFINTWTVSNHIYQPAVVVYNKAWFDGLPSDLQEILLSNRRSETRSGRREIRSLTPLLLQNLAAANVEVVELSDAERRAFADATSGLQAEFRRRVPTGAHLLDLILSNR
jgi:TRAP-type C4-dicarboxylate transport system substrate-binding protein